MKKKAFKIGKVIKLNVGPLYCDTPFFCSLANATEMKTPNIKNKSQTIFKTCKYRLSATKSCNRKRNQEIVHSFGE